MWNAANGGGAKSPNKASSELIGIGDFTHIDSRSVTPRDGYPTPHREHRRRSSYGQKEVGKSQFPRSEFYPLLGACWSGFAHSEVVSKSRRPSSRARQSSKSAFVKFYGRNGSGAPQFPTPPHRHGAPHPPPATARRAI